MGKKTKPSSEKEKEKVESKIDMTNNDENVVRTRLLLDGDGTGDDRRLNNISKMFIKWVVTKDDENPEKAKEDNKMHYSRLMASIAQCEWTENKSKLVQDMNRTEAKNYEKLYEQIKLEISQAEEEIRQTKADLVEARKVRRNRMEYDALAKVISKNPDRSTQGRKIEDVKAELDDLKATEDALETKFESRKKQFHVLVQSIHNLQALLDEDNDISFHSSRMKEDANESIEDGIMDTS